MYHPRFYGDFYDMGYKYGKLLREKANFVLPKINEQKKDFGLRSFEELKKFAPEYISEITGFSDGINDSSENVGAFLLSLGIFELSGQCSVFAFKNNDTVIFGRNYDMLFDLKKFTESSLIAPKDRYAYVSQSDVFIGRSDGINEKGLAVAMSFVNGTELTPGISFHFIIRKVLENCSTTEEAIRLIQDVNVASANNFLIADKNGDIAVVEAAPQKKYIRRPSNEENHIFITNQFVSEEMKKYDKQNVDWSKSLERYKGLNDNLSNHNSLDLNTAKQILSDKCICLDLKNEKFGTIWSVVSELNSLTIERAEGKPKFHNYKKETRLDWWLKKKVP